MPISDSTDSATALTHSSGFRARRTPDGIVLEFPVLRAPGAALGLIAFALLCGLMPAIGLSALLPLESGNVSAMMSLALIGGLAAPFMLASVVFALLAVYLLVNSLRVEISADGIRTERRVFGRVTKTSVIARTDIADVKPRIGARYQNVFSSMPRYMLVANPHDPRGKAVVVAEDLSGQSLMVEVRTLICTALGLQ